MLFWDLKCLIGDFVDWQRCALQLPCLSMLTAQTQARAWTVSSIDATFTRTIPVMTLATGLG
jgi:conjugal transfer/entry exclusion protein